MKISHILFACCALTCLALPAAAQQSSIVGETVIVQIDDQLITSRDVADENRRLLYKNPMMDPRSSEPIAITNLIQRALTVHVAPKLEVPLEHYSLITDDHILQEIERAGSRLHFLKAKNLEFGMTTIKEYHDYIYHNYIYTHVLSIVVGNQQTSGKGLRVILDPSPKEIRHTYIENEEFQLAPAVLEWSLLKFYPGRTGDKTAQEVAAQAIRELKEGKINAQQLVEMADDAIEMLGEPEDTASWVIDFISTASENDVLVGPASKYGLAGTVSLVLITKRVPAQEYSFKDAQPLIKKHLRAVSQNKTIEDFFISAAAEVDVWVTDDIPLLKAFVSQIIRRDIPANNSTAL